ncbi:MAG: hypothetical protein U0R69_07525 [Gaiellales bacterium]
MSVIVPRWEWRTFGDDFGAAEARLASLVPVRAQESDEVYVLSSEADESVKIRDELMDVKHLVQVNDDGLEQWTPVLKGRFPLSADVAGSVLRALGAPVPPLERESYTLAELMDELVAPSELLHTVRVSKLRKHYDIGGCMTELTEIRTERSSMRTIVVESEDPALVIATVRELSLEARPNVSFPRGLKTLVGFGARTYAVVDVGTNSVKFQLAELRADGTWQAVVDRAEVTRLGEALEDTGVLGSEPMARTVEAIAGMVEEAGQHGASALAAVGTAGLRIASNSDTFVAAVRSCCGVEVEVIPGEEEARLAFLAARSGLGLRRGSLAVFDTGGGSSQFTFGHGDTVDERFSVNVGAVRYTERYGLGGVVSEDVLGEAQNAIAADLGRLDGRETPAALVALGGAATNLAAVKHGLATYDPDIVQGTVLELGEVGRQIELYRTSTAEERRRIVGLQSGRAEVILAGACVVRAVMTKLGCGSLTVSDRGLRHGLLVERFGP